VQQVAQLGRPAGEVGDVVRQRERMPRVEQRRRRGRFQLRVVVQDLLVAAHQLATRIDAELVAEQAPAVREGAQGFGLPTGAAQRDHQVRAQSFTQRMFADELLQFGHQLATLAGGEPKFHQLLGRGEASFVQGGGGRPDHRPVEPGQRRSAPQLEGGPQVGDRGVLVAGRVRRPGRREMAVEHPQVQLPVVDGQPVARPVGADELVAAGQSMAQVEHHLAGLVGGRAGRALAPHRLDQAGDRGDPVGAQQQHGQRPLMARPANAHGFVVNTHLKCAENPKIAVLP